MATTRGADSSIAAYYFREIDRIPLLTAEDEVTLARQIESGRAATRALAEGAGEAREEGTRLEAEVAAGRRARLRMVESNSRLVVSIARKYAGHGVPFLDLVQEGNLGLIQAVERFDHRRGCRFSTYAMWWIRRAVEHAVAEHGPALRLPAHAAQQRRELARAMSELRGQLGREPTIEEIAAACGVSCQRVRKALASWLGPISIDEIGDTDEGRAEGDGWSDRPETLDLVSPDDELERDQLQSEVAQVLAGLSRDEIDVLALRYGLADGTAYKPAEVASRFGTTGRRVREIEGRALGKLRYSRQSQWLQEYAA